MKNALDAFVLVAMFAPVSVYLVAMVPDLGAMTITQHLVAGVLGFCGAAGLLRYWGV